jgi:hypothetical protein
MLGMQAVAAVGLVVYGISFGLSVATVVGLPCGALLLTAALFAIGSRVRRSTDELERFEAASTARPFTRAEVAAKMRRVAVTVVVAFVTAAGGITAFVLSVGVGEAGFPEPWLLSVVCFSLGLALICGGGAAVLVSFPMLGMLQHQARTLAERRAVSRAVLKNLPESLADESRVPAARYAGIYSAYLPFQWAQLGAIFGGLLFMQATVLLGGVDEVSVANRVLLIVCVVAVVTVPFALARQARNVRRYAADSAHLLEPTSA